MTEAHIILQNPMTFLVTGVEEYKMLLKTHCIASSMILYSLSRGLTYLLFHCETPWCFAGL
jgi:hypothetical protein